MESDYIALESDYIALGSDYVCSRLHHLLAVLIRNKAGYLSSLGLISFVYKLGSDKTYPFIGKIPRMALGTAALSMIIYL